jgi:hypothetical protein
MKTDKDSRFSRYRTFWPNWIGDFGPMNPTFWIVKLTRHASATPRKMPSQEFYLTVMARTSAQALCWTISPKIELPIFWPPIIASIARQSLKLSKHTGFIRQPLATVACCEVGSIPRRVPSSLRRKPRMIFPSCGYRLALLAGSTFPDGPPPLNFQALASSGFIILTRTSRQPPIHT